LARPEFDIVVIGGGAGGLVVAAGGAALGAKVALVEKHRLGGDCLWTGCVPSKALLQSARVAHTMRHADRWALAPVDPRPDLAAVMDRVAGVIAGIAPHDSPERFRALGVEVLFGAGRFVGPDAFEVAGRRLTARTFVLATGSRPAVPPIPGLADVPHLTNETLFALREPVPSLLVIGGGPVGCEMAQAFRRLGSDVAVVEAAPGILPREDPDVAAVVRDALVAEGVRLHVGATVAKVEGAAGDLRLTVTAPDGTAHRLHGTHLLVAAGRHANVEDLGLDAAGVRAEGPRLVVDDRLRTTNPRIRAIGDVAGGPQLTHVAEHHAGVVLRQAIFRMAWARPSRVIPWVTYTDPELARVGLSESEASSGGGAHKVYRFPFADLDRARTDGHTAGFAKFVTDPRGRLLGAAIVGTHAGELLPEAVLAMSRAMDVGAIAAAIHAYPTLAQVNRRVADQRLRETLTPAAKTWLRRIFRLRGA
jgi:pyruvate/2-oxoglutarate dehydrogenase complex dihydrolipoamide dehydrogenase (E3) component